MMNVHFFIAGRIRFKDRIAVISIAVSFIVIIIAVAVSSGFRQEIRRGISDISGDVMLMPPGKSVLESTSPIDADGSYLPLVEDIDGVSQIRPAVYCPGLLKQKEELYGVIFKGTEDESMFHDSVSLAVSLPSGLAEQSGIKVGDRISAYFISDKVKVRQFNVVSTYEPLAEIGTNPVIKARLSDLQRLKDWESDQVSCIEVILDDAHKSPEDIMNAAAEAGTLVSICSSDEDSSVISASSVSRFRIIFDWLDVIEFNVFFILLLMTIVAGFNMISSLLILLFENISTIGLLKSMGMTDRSISKVFLASSASLVLKGMFWGNLAAIVFCIVQGTTHLLKLDPENYFVSYVPVNLDLGAVLAADMIAFTAIMGILLIPCMFISRVDPAETVRVK